MKSASVVLCILMSAPGANGQYRRGVNVAGAEFGMSNIPGVLGKDYTFNSESTFRYFAENRLGLIRLPLLWERLQPVLRGQLDSAYLSNLKRDIAWAGAHGGEVIVDVHNFARYSRNSGGSLETYVIDNPASDGAVKVSSADLADLWVRLSNEFKFDISVYAYDLMNEPHDMGRADWKKISQTVLDAIRANQDDKLILIPGDSWSSANRWVTTHGPLAWIQDPANNFAYEAHQYFDRDESGTYARTYDAELAANSDLANSGRTRVLHFIDWLRANNVRGIVDEFGIPGSDSRWAVVLENFLSALDAAGLDGAYWAAGEWWGNYSLSVQPGGNFTVDRPQMATLQAHAGGGFLTALSSASLSVARATTGSLVTIYGRGFTDQTADVMVQVTDASGSTVLADLLYVSPDRLNIRMPDGLISGRVTIAVMRAGAQVASGSMQLAATGPAIFTANGAGYGVADAQIVRVKSDGSQTYENIAGPIDFGTGDDRLFLALYGTGVRGASISLRIGAVDMPGVDARPQGQSPGLDQVTVELPRSFAGAGQVDVTLKCDGVAANTVVIAFQ